MGLEDTYLELAVGPFALALAAQRVVLVLQDVRTAPAVKVRDAQVPFVDLAAVFGGAPRPEVPFMIAVEHDRDIVGVGIDRVGHLRRRDAPTLHHVPAFGLAVPELFAGAVRDGERLLLVVEPARLVSLTRERAGNLTVAEGGRYNP